MPVFIVPLLPPRLPHGNNWEGMHKSKFGTLWDRSEFGLWFSDDSSGRLGIVRPQWQSMAKREYSWREVGFWEYEMIRMRRSLEA